MKITGSGFTGSTTAAMVSGDMTLAASTDQVLDSNTLLATFDLKGFPTGSYGLKMTNVTSTATLPNAFTVQPPSNKGLVFSLDLPGVSRGDLPDTMYLQYANTGNTDIPAPYFFISGDNTEFELPGQTAYSDDSIEVLGIAPTGVASTLAPGQSNSIPITYTQIQIIGHQQAQLQVSDVDPADVIDLPVLQTEMQPVNEPADAWNAIFGNFLAEVGNTVGGLGNVLRNAADALSTQGTRTGDLDQLLNYALEEAGDFGQITARYELGPFGRGQGDPVGEVATADSSGNVYITSGGTEEIFIKQLNGTYQGTPGDTSRLTEGGGIYTLTDTSGEMTVFNADGTLNYFQDADGNRLTAHYTGGLLTSLVATDGDTFTDTYNAQLRITQVTDPEGRATTYAYDPTGQLLTSITTTQGTTTFTYYNGPNLADRYAITSIDYPDGTDEFYTCDAMGRLIGQSLNGGAEPVTYTYDDLGNVTSTNALGQTQVSSMSSNQINQVSTVEDGLGDIARTAYDQNGQPTATTGPNGLSTTTTYDTDGNPTSITDAAGSTIHFSYSPTLNELLSITDPNGNETTNAYDADGSLTSTTDAAGNTTSYTYDSAGNVTSVTHPNATGETDVYNAQNLLIERTFSDGTTITCTYDAHRNLLSADDSASGTVSYTYDAADNLTSFTYPDGLSLQYTYDAAGQLNNEVDQTGFTTNYIYNALGQLTELTNASGQMITAYTYNAAGNLSQTSNANGTFTTDTYNIVGETTSIVNHAPGGAVNSSFAYTYNSAGEETSVVSNSGATTYSYDATGQLTQVVLPGGRTITYAYDSVGNRIEVSDSAASTVSYTTNNLDEYVTVGGTTYTYDRDGNLLSSTTGGVTTTYTYNARGELVSVTSPGSAITYLYDAVGDRIASTDNGVTTQYLIDPMVGDNVVGTFAPSGDVTNHYVYGVGLSSSLDASGAASFYDFDATGNTADVTGSNGSVESSYTYLPFGQILSSTGSTSNLFTFGGQLGVQNSGDGLYAMGARFYDPSIGRFTQQDPLGLSGGDINTYRYAGNDPINRADPTGLASIGLVSESANASLNMLGELTDGAVPSIQSWCRFEVSALQNIQQALTVDAKQATVDSVVATLKAQLGDQLATTTVSDMGNASVSDVIAILSARALADAAQLQADLATALSLKQAEADALAALNAAIAQNQGAMLETQATGAFLNAATGGATIIYNSMKAIADAENFNAEFPDGIPIQPEEVIAGPAYSNAMKRPLAQQLIQNLLKQGITPTEDFIAMAIKLDADLVRKQNGPPLPDTPTNYGNTQFINADDPNDLIGPAGYGPAGYVPVDQTLPYEITFENAPTASTPAKVVTITEQLDANLDWSTFELGNMRFGAFTVNVPAGLTSYQTSVSVSSSLSVDISAQFNVLTGMATWTLTSIDPSTGDVPAGALAGFLPPDQANSEGWGYVTYTVSAQPSAVSGTAIHAQATIVFDNNPPINTPNFLNTIDAGNPTSSVAPLPPTEPTSFTLGWGGQGDPNGSGVDTYTIFVSDDGGPFVPFLLDTTQTSTTFTGQVGHTYGFYSITTGNVGNIQPTPAAAQARTSVIFIPLVTVESLQVEKVKVGKGKKAKRETVLVLRFSGALNAGAADNVGAYQLAPVITVKAKGRGKHKKPATTKLGTPVTPASAVYSASSNQVTLTPRGTLNLRKPEELIVSGALLTDTLGREIDGSGNGQAGSEYIATLSGGRAAVGGLPLARTQQQSAFVAAAIDDLLARGELTRRRIR